MMSLPPEMIHEITKFTNPEITMISVSIEDPEDDPFEKMLLLNHFKERKLFYQSPKEAFINYFDSCNEHYDDWCAFLRYFKTYMIVSLLNIKQIKIDDERFDDFKIPEYRFDGEREYYCEDIRDFMSTIDEEENFGDEVPRLLSILEMDQQGVDLRRLEIYKKAAIIDHCEIDELDDMFREIIRDDSVSVFDINQHAYYIMNNLIGGRVLITTFKIDADHGTDIAHFENACCNERKYHDFEIICTCTDSDSDSE